MADPLRVAEVEAVANSHPSILEPSVDELEDGGFKLQFRMKVQDARDGRKNGVQDEEPVDVIFPSSWPMKAPTVRLRKDFCRNIAHINPTHELDPQWVSPCIVDVPLDMFVRVAGLHGLFDQLQEWLDNVAFDHLRERDGRWEPMRRDGLPFFAIADVARLRDYVGHNPGNQFLVSTKNPHPLGGDDAQFFVVHENRFGSAISALNNVTAQNDICVALLTWGATRNIVGDIFPDTRCDLTTLLDAAREFRMS